MIKIIILSLLVFIQTADVALASGEVNLFSEQLSSFDFANIDRTMESSGGAVQISFTELITGVLAGELSLSPAEIFRWIVRTALNEIYSSGFLMVQLVIIALLSAVINALTDSFKTKSVGEIGFYVCYAALVSVLLSSIRISIDAMSTAVSNMANLMQSSLPLMAGLMVMAGDVACAIAMEPLVLLSVNSITVLLQTLIIPLAISAAVIQTVNYLTEKETLGKLSELIRKSCILAFTVFAVLFSIILSLVRISAPIINNLALRTARSAGGAVPVVGGFLTSAVDTVLFWAAAVRSAALVSIITAIILICGIPIIKMLAMVVIYKFTAAVIEPICDKRIVKCIDTIGTYTLLFACATTVVTVMFIFSVVMMLSFGGLV
ncbi:MAG: stage III sporulation protein AE [Defluviitaleaceae bacterium]|nr:stage III sporulation protein AE [Defluviitaleaceae bacterium]